MSHRAAAIGRGHVAAGTGRDVTMNRGTLARRYAPLVALAAIQLLIIATVPSKAGKSSVAANKFNPGSGYAAGAPGSVDTGAGATTAGGAAGTAGGAAGTAGGSYGSSAGGVRASGGGAV